MGRQKLLIGSIVSIFSIGAVFLTITNSSHHHHSSHSEFINAVSAAEYTPQGTMTVNISGMTLPNITINQGDSIRWKNLDGVAHTATSDIGSAFTFDTGSIAGGATSGAITFTQVGTFGYHCTPHPGMTATITVNAASTSTPTPTATHTPTPTASPTSSPIPTVKTATSTPTPTKVTSTQAKSATATPTMTPTTAIVSPSDTPIPVEPTMIVEGIGSSEISPSPSPTEVTQSSNTELASLDTKATQSGNASNMAIIASVSVVSVIAASASIIYFRQKKKTANPVTTTTP